MTPNGYLCTECDIMSPAKEFFDNFIELMEQFIPKVDVKVVNENVTVVIEGVPLEKEKTSYRIEGIQISEWYESLEAERTNTHDVATWQNLNNYEELEGIMTTSHAEGNDRDRAILTIQYKKISSDIKDPEFIMNAFVQFIGVMDDDLLNPID